MSRDIQPSQSPAVTAPPEGEPRHTPTPASERSCLSPRERWQCRRHWRTPARRRACIAPLAEGKSRRGVEGVGGDALLARRLIQRAVSRRVGHRPALFKPTLFFPRQLSIVNSSACSTNARSSAPLRSSCGAAARARREARFSSARSAAPSMPSCAARTHCSTAQASL